MKKKKLKTLFWFGLVDKRDDAVKFGSFEEAYTEKAARAIIKSKYPNSRIKKIIECGTLKNS